ncbi:MAG: hypothetical protein ACREXM_12775 [Gammaproteobacteria bacterium]
MEGKIVFKPPEEMAANKTETLEARITLQEVTGPTGTTGTTGRPTTTTTTTSGVLEGIRGSGQTRIEEIKVSRMMKVALIAEEEDFRITPITKDERYLDPQEPYISWKWGVTPLKLGTHDIHLVAEAMVEKPGGTKEVVYVKTFDHRIRVTVTRDSVYDWVLTHWEKIILAFAAIVGAGWTFYTWKKESSK